MKTSGRPALLRKLNQSIVLEIVRERGPISQADIARISGVSCGAVCHIVQELLQQGRLLNAGYGTSKKGGRRPILLQFNPRVESMIGVDMGADRQVAVLTDLNGEVIEERQVDVLDPSHALEILLRLVNELLEASREVGSPVRGMGVGVPGSVETDTGIVNFARAFRWSRFPLGEWIRSRVSVPVVVDNDVNMAILGEMWRGAGIGKRNLAMIVATRGVGAGIVINGTLYRGSRDAAGEIGYMVTSPESLLREYTSWGFLEGLIGQRALVEKIKRERAGTARDALSEDEFCEILRQGDDFSTRLINEICTHLSMVIANTVALLNPELVIVGGYIARLADIFVERISTAVRHLVPVPCEIVTPTLGQRSVAIGAVAAAISQSTKIIKLEAE